MLTAKEIKDLPKGTYSNSKLRRKFGKKHSSEVKQRAEVKPKEFVEYTITGNRQQRKLRLKNPLKPLKVQNNAKVPAPVKKVHNLFYAALNYFSKIMKFYSL